MADALLAWMASADKHLAELDQSIKGKNADMEKLDAFNASNAPALASLREAEARDAARLTELDQEFSACVSALELGSEADDVSAKYDGDPSHLAALRAAAAEVQDAVLEAARETKKQREMFAARGRAVAAREADLAARRAPLTATSPPAELSSVAAALKALDNDKVELVALGRKAAVALDAETRQRAALQKRIVEVVEALAREVARKEKLLGKLTKVMADQGISKAVPLGAMRSGPGAGSRASMADPSRSGLIDVRYMDSRASNFTTRGSAGSVSGAEERAQGGDTTPGASTAEEIARADRSALLQWIVEAEQQEADLIAAMQVTLQSLTEKLAADETRTAEVSALEASLVAPRAEFAAVGKKARGLYFELGKLTAEKAGVPLAVLDNGDKTAQALEEACRSALDEAAAARGIIEGNMAIYAAGEREVEEASAEVKRSRKLADSIEALSELTHMIQGCYDQRDRLAVGVEESLAACGRRAEAHARFEDAVKGILAFFGEETPKRAQALERLEAVQASNRERAFGEERRRLDDQIAEAELALDNHARAGSVSDQRIAAALAARAEAAAQLEPLVQQGASISGAGAGWEKPDDQVQAEERLRSAQAELDATLATLSSQGGKIVQNKHAARSSEKALLALAAPASAAEPGAGPARGPAGEDALVPARAAVIAALRAELEVLRDQVPLAARASTIKAGVAELAELCARHDQNLVLARREILKSRSTPVLLPTPAPAEHGRPRRLVTSQSLEDLLASDTESPMVPSEPAEVASPAPQPPASGAAAAAAATASAAAPEPERPHAEKTPASAAPVPAPHKLRLSQSLADLLGDGEDDGIAGAEGDEASPVTGHARHPEPEATPALRDDKVAAPMVDPPEDPEVVAARANASRPSVPVGVTAEAFLPPGTSYETRYKVEKAPTQEAATDTVMDEQASGVAEDSFSSPYRLTRTVMGTPRIAYPWFADTFAQETNPYDMIARRRPPLPSAKGSAREREKLLARARILGVDPADLDKGWTVKRKEGVAPAKPKRGSGGVFIFPELMTLAPSTLGGEVGPSGGDAEDGSGDAADPPALASLRASADEPALSIQRPRTASRIRGDGSELGSAADPTLSLTARPSSAPARRPLSAVSRAASITSKLREGKSERPFSAMLHRPPPGVLRNKEQKWNDSVRLIPWDRRSVVNDSVAAGPVPFSTALQSYVNGPASISMSEKARERELLKETFAPHRPESASSAGLGPGKRRPVSAVGPRGGGVAAAGAASDSPYTSLSSTGGMRPSSAPVLRDTSQAAAGAVGAILHPSPRYSETERYPFGLPQPADDEATLLGMIGGGASDGIARPFRKAIQHLLALWGMLGYPREERFAFVWAFRETTAANYAHILAEVSRFLGYREHIAWILERVRMREELLLDIRSYLSSTETPEGRDTIVRFLEITVAITQAIAALKESLPWLQAFTYRGANYEEKMRDDAIELKRLRGEVDERRQRLMWLAQDKAEEKRRELALTAELERERVALLRQHEELEREGENEELDFARRAGQKLERERARAREQAEMDRLLDLEEVRLAPGSSGTDLVRQVPNPDASELDRRIRELNAEQEESDTSFSPSLLQNSPSRASVSPTRRGAGGGGLSSGSGPAPRAGGISADDKELFDPTLLHLDQDFGYYRAGERRDASEGSGDHHRRAASAGRHRPRSPGRSSRPVRPQSSSAALRSPGLAAPPHPLAPQSSASAIANSAVARLQQLAEQAREAREAEARDARDTRDARDARDARKYEVREAGGGSVRVPQADRVDRPLSAPSAAPGFSGGTSRRAPVPSGRTPGAYASGGGRKPTGQQLQYDDEDDHGHQHSQQQYQQQPSTQYRQQQGRARANPPAAPQGDTGSEGQMYYDEQEQVYYDDQGHEYFDDRGVVYQDEDGQAYYYDDEGQWQPADDGAAGSAGPQRGVQGQVRAIRDGPRAGAAAQTRPGSAPAQRYEDQKRLLLEQQARHRDDEDEDLGSEGLLDDEGLPLQGTGDRGQHQDPGSQLQRQAHHLRSNPSLTSPGMPSRGAPDDRRVTDRPHQQQQQQQQQSWARAQSPHQHPQQENGRHRANNAFAEGPGAAVGVRSGSGVDGQGDDDYSGGAGGRPKIMAPGKAPPRFPSSSPALGYSDEEDPSLGVQGPSTGARLRPATQETASVSSSSVRSQPQRPGSIAVPGKAPPPFPGARLGREEYFDQYEGAAPLPRSSSQVQSYGRLPSGGGPGSSQSRGPSPLHARVQSQAQSRPDLLAGAGPRATGADQGSPDEAPRVQRRPIPDGRDSGDDGAANEPISEAAYQQLRESLQGSRGRRGGAPVLPAQGSGAGQAGGSQPGSGELRGALQSQSGASAGPAKPSKPPPPLKIPGGGAGVSPGPASAAAAAGARKLSSASSSSSLLEISDMHSSDFSLSSDAESVHSVKAPAPAPPPLRPAVVAPAAPPPRPAPAPATKGTVSDDSSILEISWHTSDEEQFDKALALFDSDISDK